MALNQCPRCNYSLRGLPANHACPECGLVYDERSACWRRKPGVGVYAGLLGYLASAYWMAILPRKFPGFPPLVRVLVVIMFVVYVGSLVYVAWRLWGVYKKGVVIALLPDGLYYRRDAGSLEKIPWEDISRVAAVPYPLGLGVFHKQAKAVRTLTGVFRSRRDVERCVALINERLASGVSSATPAS
ncbi:MAG: hypothetical protein D6788_09830 [Planctomycetota bacterium]|nr:MAG: hypothetical protein D6788_09830 [Planctomycetota bacterium]